MEMQYLLHWYEDRDRKFYSSCSPEDFAYHLVYDHPPKRDALPAKEELLRERFPGLTASEIRRCFEKAKTLYGESWTLAELSFQRKLTDKDAKLLLHERCPGFSELTYNKCYGAASRMVMY